MRLRLMSWALIKRTWREGQRKARRQCALQRLDDIVLPAVKDELSAGRLVVLIGATGVGKSVLAEKALPDSVPMPRDGMLENDEIEGIIGDEISGCDPELIIKVRNRALGAGIKILLTGQRWRDIAPFLCGLEVYRYRIFNLDASWDLNQTDEEFKRKLSSVYNYENRC